MPPRFVYWTIIAGGLPTAFRAAEREELLPTFKRIQEKHPDAVMKYFARGRLWESAEEAKQEADARRARAPRGDVRGRDWRPGGEHRDPRQKFKDAKKKRNLDWRKERFERRQAGAEPPREKPHGDPLRRPAGRPPARKFDGPPREQRKFDGPPRERKPAGERPWRPKGPPRDRKFDEPPRERKFGGPPRDRKPGAAPRERKPGGPRREFKPGGPPRDRRRRG
jgi:23S rRNA pseudouridine2605 synthase